MLQTRLPRWPDREKAWPSAAGWPNELNSWPTPNQRAEETTCLYKSDLPQSAPRLSRVRALLRRIFRYGS